MRLKKTVLAAMTLMAAVSAHSNPVEATVASLHAEIRAGKSCESITQSFLDRIAAYDQKGPKLKAILAVNQQALDQARALDARYKQDARVLDKLFCVPVIAKDNFDVAGMPTTGANVSMKDSMPDDDAFAIRKMKEAGAIILAKSNLMEFARGGTTVSSLGGQTLNPYDLTRTPGGSSGGSGVAMAASYGVLSTGSDTGQSIRSPASAHSLVGVRPTRGLISRDGVMPNSFTQDEIGPITRTVSDAARMLDVIVGFDPADPITALGVGKTPKSYLDALDKDALRGARVGLLVDTLGDQERHAPVSTVMKDTVEKMKALGATVVEVRIPGYKELTSQTSTDQMEARDAFNFYFKTLPANAPVRDFDQLVALKQAHPAIQKALEAEAAVQDGMNSDRYKTRTLNREKLRIALAAAMAENKVDALLYPLQSVLVAPIGDHSQPERNGVLSNGTGFPAVTFPAGFSEPSQTARLGVPVGAELLALDYTEPKLLSYAFAFEQAYQPRKAPALTAPLK